MTKKRDLFREAMNNPSNVKFADLLTLAKNFGFVHDRTKGSHKIFKRFNDPRHLISFQPDSKNKKMAKPYQVRQLLDFIEENDLKPMVKGQ